MKKIQQELEWQRAKLARWEKNGIFPDSREILKGIIKGLELAMEVYRPD